MFVTYWLNRLQTLGAAPPLFLSLNAARRPREETVLAEFTYDHPQFDGAAIAALYERYGRTAFGLALKILREETEAEDVVHDAFVAIAQRADQYHAARGTVALLVAQRGRLVYERYFDGFAADDIGNSFSMAKSVVSVLLGIAIDDGRIAGVDEPVTRYLPELRGNDPRFDRITLRHLLAMRSGIAFDEGYATPFSDVARFYLGPDLKALVAGLRIGSEPDRLFRYQSGDTQLLAMAIERAVGQPLAQFAEQRLWRPLGAQHDASWSLDSRAGGVARAFCCLNARAADYLRFGLMVAADGEWNGRRIVSRDWLRRSTAAQTGLPGPADPAWRNIERPHAPEAAFYAWQWRVRPLPAAPGGPPLQPGPMVYAQGLLGQILLIDRDSQTVVLRLGRRQGGRHWPTWMDELVRLNR